MPLFKKSVNSHTWFYGWVIVGVSFLTLTVVFGVRLSFSVFFVALIDEFGWSRADTALIFSTSMIVFAATSTLTGIALDKWGARHTFGVGAAIMALGLLLSSQIQNIYQLAITYGGIAGFGVTILGLGLQASLIARWFKQRRGLAIGIAFAGTGIGALLITPGTEYLVSNFGWRAAYLVLAGLAFSTIPLIVVLLRLNPADKGLHPDGVQEDELTEESAQLETEWNMRETVRNPAFWLVLIAALGAIGPVRMLTVHQLAILIEAGFERAYAAKMIGFSGAITAVAFILLGTFSDKFGRRLIYLLGSLSLVVAIIILDRLGNPGQSVWVWLYAILLGFGEGSRSSIVTAIASDLFPGNALGAINGAVGAFFGMGAAILPWLAGLFYGLHGNYRLGFVVSVGIVILSTLSLWFAPYFQYRH